MMFSQCNTQWLYYTLRYNIKGSVATSKAMPTPFFFFSRLPEALRGLMTKQTPSCIHNRDSSPSIALINHSLNYIKTSNNRLSEKWTTSVQRTNHVYSYISNLPRSGHLTILWSRDTDQARMDTRSSLCITRLPLRMDKCYSYKLVFV